MQLNQFSIYGYNCTSESQILDEVDAFKQDLMRMTEYDDVKNFLISKYGEFEGEKWVTYPKLNKHVYLYLDKEAVKFCALENKKQYWGRGWFLEEDAENKD